MMNKGNFFDSGFAPFQGSPFGQLGYFSESRTFNTLHDFPYKIKGVRNSFLFFTTLIIVHSFLKIDV